jgi:hypothetical protein
LKIKVKVAVRNSAFTHISILTPANQTSTICTLEYSKG